MAKRAGRRVADVMMQKDTRSDGGVWEVCTNSSLKRASRRLGLLYEEAIARSGLRSTQFSLLSQIAHSGDATMRALADLMVMDLSALGQTLKPLVRDGLVELVPDDRDRRVKRIRLTDLGAQRQIEAVQLWREAQGRFEAAFGKDRSDALRDALNLIADDTFADIFRAG